MCFKKKTDNIATTTFVVNGDHEEGKITNLPSNVGKIRLETDNKNLFYRAYGLIKNPDTKFILSAPGCEMMIIKDGVSSEPLANGSYPAFKEDEIEVKKPFFGKEKKKVKEDTMFDVVVFNQNLSYEGFWGIPNPIPFRDPETAIPVDIRGRGKYDIRIADVQKFFERVVGSNRDFKMEDLLERINDHVVHILKEKLTQVIHEHHLGYIDLSLHEAEVAEAIQPLVSEMLNEQYGLYCPIFSVEQFFIDDEQRLEIETFLKNNRDEKKFKADAKELAIEAERLDDKNWERTKFLIGLRREDESKYLEVIKILGYPHEPMYSAGAKKAAEKEKEKEAPVKRYCPKCGAEVIRGEPYCPSCGEPLAPVERKCPHCGKTVKTKGKYCPHCGKEF